MTEQFVGLSPAQTSAVAGGEAILERRRQGLLVRPDDVVASVSALRQAACTADTMNGPTLFAFAEVIDGDIANARRLVREAVASHLQAPQPWGVVACVLAADVARPSVLVDWSARLVEARPHDIEAHIWAARSLGSLGQLGAATDVVVRYPHAANPQWVAAAARLANLAGYQQKVAAWAKDWAQSDAGALDAPVDGRPDVLNVLCDVLVGDEADAVLTVLVGRLGSCAAVVERVAVAMWRLAEMSGRPETAGRVFRALAENVTGETFDDDQYAHVVHGTVDRLDELGLVRLAALVMQDLWRATRDVMSGFVAVQLWRRANDAGRERAQLLTVVAALDETSLSAVTHEDRVAMGAVAAAVLVGDVDAADFGDTVARLERADVTLPASLNRPTGMSQAAVAERAVLIDLTKMLRAGHPGRARVAALRASFGDRVGCAPAGLIVDAFLEGGAHGEALQLAYNLDRLYPGDTDAIRRLCAAYVWYGRADQAVELARTALRTRPRSVTVLVDTIRWLANLDKEAAIAALDDAMGDARNELVVEQLTELRRLMGRIDG